MGLFDQLEYWHWLVLAVALIILEIFSPGVFLIWLGAAAGIVGLLMLLMPDMGWQMQVVLFAVFSVLAIVAARMFLSRHPIATDQPTLNRRGEQYLGRVFTLDEEIQNGSGKIRVDDTTWKVQGSDCPAGSKVKVAGVDGVVLLVEVVE